MSVREPTTVCTVQALRIFDLSQRYLLLKLWGASLINTVLSSEHMKKEREEHSLLFGKRSPACNYKVFITKLGLMYYVYFNVIVQAKG